MPCIGENIAGVAAGVLGAFKDLWISDK